MPSLIWFRRDLRVRDNSALYHAAKASDELIGLFVIAPGQWKEHHDANTKVSFWLENLRCLSESLEQLNIPLLIRVCDTFDESVETVVQVAQEQQCESVYFNREYEVNERRRDRAVTDNAADRNIECISFHDRVIVPPKEIATKDGRFYSVFTPYRRVWDTKAIEYAKVLPKPRAMKATRLKPDSVPDSIKGFDFAAARPDLWPAGEAEAQKRLKTFATKIQDYNDTRDLPAAPGTSLISAWLAAGVVSPRQCLAAAIKHNGGTLAGDEGTTTWVSELTWRDFYTHVMVGFPKVSMNSPFKDKTKRIPWRSNKADFQAWCEGRTGYPIVDAGMRQLNRTGWMHNRLRMVTAMFLTKNLLIDWRWGERYFMEHLIDGDLAANNGGWQWSASTGTDAVPYFRIFNPFSQSKRFDSEGNFIKKFCPELEPIPAKALHDLKKLAAAIESNGVDYPSYIVDYKEGRERALAAFKAL